MRSLLVFSCALTLACGPAWARSAGSSTHHGSSGASSSSHSASVHSSGNHKSHTAPGVPRDSHGHIKRSEQAKDQFKKSHPCPSTGKSSGACPGYVIDHKQALKHGGADAPYNMQWQTEAEAKQKDRWE
jgi:hypothetical protein